MLRALGVWLERVGVLVSRVVGSAREYGVNPRASDPSLPRTRDSRPLGQAARTEQPQQRRDEVNQEARDVTHVAQRTAIA